MSLVFPISISYGYLEKNSNCDYRLFEFAKNFSDQMKKKSVFGWGVEAIFSLLDVMSVTEE